MLLPAGTGRAPLIMDLRTHFPHTSPPKAGCDPRRRHLLIGQFVEWGAPAGALGNKGSQVQPGPHRILAHSLHLAATHPPGVTVRHPGWGAAALGRCHLLCSSNGHSGRGRGEAALAPGRMWHPEQLPWSMQCRCVLCKQPTRAAALHGDAASADDIDLKSQGQVITQEASDDGAAMRVECIQYYVTHSLQCVLGSQKFIREEREHLPPHKLPTWALIIR